MTAPTKAELETAFADCVKRRGRDVAHDILKGLARVENVADVPENRRLPPQPRWSDDLRRIAQRHPSLIQS
jgi:hypothetical protein